MRYGFRAPAILLIAVVAASRSFAAGPVGPNISHGPVQVELFPIASGLTAPVDMMAMPGSPSHQVVVDQAGKVRLITGGVLQTTPFLDVSSRLVTLNAGYDERGLLGLAFDPNYNGTPGTVGYHTVYTFTSEPVSGAADFTVPLNPGTSMNCQSVLAAWNIDTLARTELLRIDKPQSNHNGGIISFGPDGYLYLGTGDGGGANDVANGHTPVTGNAQDLTNALGKVLRIDVRGNNSTNGKYGIPADNPFTGVGQVKEIYAHGLRNPFRFSFDQPTGKLILGDVGQNNIEEVDIITKGGNYGWNRREGDHDFNPADGTVSALASATPAGLIDPIAEYDHVNGGIAIIGGLPELTNKYVFGDFSTSFGSAAGRLFYMDTTGPDANQIHEFIIGLDDRPLGMFLKGMGQDASGELYVLASTNLGPTGTTGAVFKLVPVPEPANILIMSVSVVLLLKRRRADA